MATKVLDSWALMAFFEDQAGAEEVEQLLLKAEAGKHTLLLCAVNWGEIYYAILRTAGKDAAERKAKEIAGMAIEIVGVGDDLTLARQAAVFKASKKMAYADCFAAALAKLRSAEVVTGDGEFREVEGDVKVHWLARGA
jgi:predicted nucleic acid-binding protein